MTPQAEIEGAGGAYVRRRFLFGERELAVGDILTAEELSLMPIANKRSLINLNMIEIFPYSGIEVELRAALAEKNTEIERLTALLSTPTVPPTIGGSGDCFLMPAGPRKFHIIQGRQVTEEPLTRAQASAKMKELAG
jgi:hypothetical protein